MTRDHDPDATIPDTPPASDPDATIPDAQGIPVADPDATIADASIAPQADPDLTIADAAPAPRPVDPELTIADPAPASGASSDTFADVPPPGSFQGKLDTSAAAPAPDDDATILEAPPALDRSALLDQPGVSATDATIVESPGGAPDQTDADMTMMPADEQPSSLPPGIPSTRGGSGSGSSSAGPSRGASSSALAHSVSSLDSTRLPSVRATQRLEAGSPETALFAGRYEIEKELARGGMGVVYKARHVDLNKVVAIKVMLSGIHASPTARRRFLFEAEASARLEHPHILPVTDIGEADENLYFAMQFVAGADLKERQKQLSREQFLDVMVKVADGVGYAHQKGIIHRDLKPANVMIDEQGEPLIMDFGLAKQLEDAESGAISQSQTMEGTIFGTPHYMPPEQASGEISEIDVRSDVWALGVMLYAFYTGELPYSGNSTAELLNKILSTEPRSPRAVDPTIDPDLEAIINKAMEKEKARRYASAVQLRDDLQRLRDGLPVEARRATLGYRFSKWARRHKGQLAAAAVVAVAALVGTGVGIQQHLSGYTRALDEAQATLGTVAEDGAAQAQTLAALRQEPADPAAREQAVTALRGDLGALDGQVDGLVVKLEPLLAAPLASQRQRANQLLDDARALGREVNDGLETAVGLARAADELARARGLLADELPALEAAAIEALGASVALPPLGEAEVPAEATPSEALRAVTAFHADSLRGLDAVDTAAPAEAAADAVAALETVRTAVSAAAFTAHNLAGSGTPEAAAAEQVIAEAEAVRQRVDDARAQATRLALSGRLTQQTEALLTRFDATPFAKQTRLARLAAAGVAQALVQRAQELNPAGSPALEAAHLHADIAYALALLDTKSFNAFDEFVAREGSFGPEQRERLDAVRDERLKVLDKLRRRLSGSAKVSLTGGSGVELGGTSRPELQLFPLKGKLKQLASVVDHELMDDQLEQIRRESVAKACEAFDLAVDKIAQAGNAKIRAEIEGLSDAEQAAQVTELTEAWKDIEAGLTKEQTWLTAWLSEKEAWIADTDDPVIRSIWTPRDLDDEETRQLRDSLIRGRAALYAKSAESLAESAPARARTLARLAVETVEAQHAAGRMDSVVVEEYRHRLRGLLAQ